MSVFDPGVSALNAAQDVLNLIGNNLANSSTPGYHRQVADLTEADPVVVEGNYIGSGVQVSDTRRQIDNLLETAITNQTYAAASTSAQLNTMQQVQTSLNPTSGSLHTDLETFFNNLNQLAANPTDTTQRAVVVGSAQTVSGDFNGLAASLNQMQTGLDGQLTNAVADVNSLAQRIAQLNGSIRDASARGPVPNDQLDQRDQLVNQLAQDLDVRTSPAVLNQVNVVVAGVPIVVGDQSVALQYSLGAAGQGQLTVAGTTAPLTPTGGQVAGLLAARNGSVADVQSQLNTLAATFMQQVDGIQATGLGLSGPSSFLSGTRAVNNVNTPLANAGLAFPPQAGTLYVSVTNQATGARTLTAVNIDPATMSLNDVANALSAVPDVQAVTDAQTGTMQIMARPGYAVDFAGRLPTAPNTAGYTGSATPTVGGQYTGTTNDTYTFKVIGSGTVGVSSNLQLQVTNAAGSPVATVNVGAGYSPGTPLTVANGVTVQLAAGNVNNNDTFSTPVVARPDSAGILTALGIGTFFTGNSATDMAVQSALANNPAALAGSRTGAAGDNSNLTRLTALQTQPLLAGGTQTITQGYDAIVGSVATQVQALTTAQTSQKALGQQLQNQQQTVSGVDPNQELVNMMNFQRQFQIASEYIGSVASTLQSMLTILQPVIG